MTTVASRISVSNRSWVRNTMRSATPASRIARLSSIDRVDVHAHAARPQFHRRDHDRNPSPSRGRRRRRLRRPREAHHFRDHVMRRGFVRNVGDSEWLRLATRGRGDRDACENGSYPVLVNSSLHHPSFIFPWVLIRPMRHDMQTLSKSAADVAKLRELRRMQAIALALLLTMVALLAISAANVAAHPWAAWFKAFAEAALVGAVADWFAVVALFRHPLGLPIAHTAIIPIEQGSHRREPRPLRRGELPDAGERHAAPGAREHRQGMRNLAQRACEQRSHRRRHLRDGPACDRDDRGRRRREVPHPHCAGRAGEGQSRSRRRRTARACYVRRAVPGHARRCARGHRKADRCQPVVDPAKIRRGVEVHTGIPR